ncbi:MAG TPA: hypothetical protein VGR90_06050 [Acidimicrobiales bacterium]|nr:hypothetical protein [Acidimicrobiales bacterium]
MTNNDAGLPLPKIKTPLPQPPPPLAPTPSKLPDPTAWSQYIASDHSGLGKYANQVGGSHTTTPPSGPSLGSVPGFQPVLTTYQQADQMFATGQPAQVAGAVLRFIFPGISGIPQNYYATKITQWQQDFLSNYGDYMDLMSDELRRLEDSIDDQRQILQQPPKPHDNLDQLLDQKRNLGNDLLNEIGQKLQASDDPDEQAQLRSLYQDVQGWMRQRDAAVDGEAPQVYDMQRKFAATGDAASQLDDQLAKTGNAVHQAIYGPPSMSGPRDVSTVARQLNNLRPDVLATIAQTKDFLLGTRSTLDSAISG